MKTRLIRTAEIPTEAIVNVTEYGQHAEIVYSKNHGYITRTRRVSGTQYVDLDTGEIKKYVKQRKTEVQLYPTYRRLKQLIYNNFPAEAGEYMITLTYKNKMESARKLTQDTQKFLRKMKNTATGQIMYIVIAEAQGSALHAHILLKQKTGRLLLNRDIISKKWAHGFSNIRRIYSTNNLAYYFTKTQKVAQAAAAGNIKRIYRGSLNLVQPKKIKMKYADAQQKYAATKSKGTTIEIYNNSNHVVQKIIKEQRML